METTRSTNDISLQVPKDGKPKKPDNKPVPKKSKSIKKLLVTLTILLLLAALGFFAWQYLENKKEIARLQNPEVAAQDATDQLVKEVGMLIQLPKGETPTVAVVVKADELREQPFFAEAKNGDQVLIYSQAKEAILYRPSTKKIIKVAPVDLGEDATK